MITYHKIDLIYFVCVMCLNPTHVYAFIQNREGGRDEDLVCCGVLSYGLRTPCIRMIKWISFHIYMSNPFFHGIVLFLNNKIKELTLDLRTIVQKKKKKITITIVVFLFISVKDQSLRRGISTRFKKVTRRNNVKRIVRRSKMIRYVNNCKRETKDQDLNAQPSIKRSEPYERAILHRKSQYFWLHAQACQCFSLLSHVGT